MNKTININLGGFFFHIDEIAYQKLKRYLESISRSLSDDPQGKNEIIADIEARISELLSEKITDARQVVNEGDIDDIIGIMGQPEDYAEAEESYSSSSYSYQRNSASGKKLFRDGDDKFLGGVASGIAHYFDVDTIWIRLGLLALFFGAGFGVLLYIILWILLPEAKTTAEKLQMEGEPVNIDNIEKKIREEFTNVSESVRNVANQASEKIKDGANEFSEKMSKTFSGKTKKNNGLQDFINALGKIILAVFKVFGKFIGVILVFVAAAVILSLIIGGFSVGSLEFLNVDGVFLQYPPFFYDSVLPKWLLTSCLIILIIIPFLILFILGLRILSSNVKKLSKTASLTLLGIWLISLLTLVFTGIEFGSSHAIEGKSIIRNDLNIAPKDTLKIKIVNDDNLIIRDYLKREKYRRYEVEIDGEPKTYGSNIFVDVKKSNSNKNYISVRKTSLGRNRINAKKNSEKIEYNYGFKNNTLELDAFYISNFRNFFKEEEIKITVYVTENTVVYFDNSTKNFLYNVDNTTDTYDKEMANKYFTMTEKGLHNQELKDLEDSEIED